MPAYSFKERFVPMIKDGTKTQTIRSYRKAIPKEGQLAHLYYGMRTKYCVKLIANSPVIEEVKTIYIDRSGRLFVFDVPYIEPSLILDKSPCGIKSPHEIFGNWRQIFSQIHLDQFAWDDGFRHTEEGEEYNIRGCYDIMLRWWRKNNGLPFIGNLIKWQ